MFDSLAIHQNRRESLSLFYGNEFLFAAHIRSEDLGNIHAAVCVEVIFKQGDEHSRRSDNGVVERVGIILAAVFAVDSYLESARLSVAEIGAGADLEIFLLSG